MVFFHQIDFELWWPNGFGAQKLYAISVSLNSSNEISHKSFMWVQVIPIVFWHLRTLNRIFPIKELPVCLFLSWSRFYPHFSHDTLCEQVRFSRGWARARGSRWRRWWCSQLLLQSERQKNICERSKLDSRRRFPQPSDGRKVSGSYSKESKSA